MSIVGRVLTSNEQFTLLEASDHQQVRILSRGGLSLPSQSFVEIIGVVNKDQSLTEMNRISYSDNFNLELHEEVIRMSQRQDLKQIFG